MSSMATIRKLDDVDKARVTRAAERFCNRHGISFGFDDAETMIDYWLYSAHPEIAAYRRKLWIACYCRALRVPVDVRTTTGWGYIGVSCD